MDVIGGDCLIIYLTTLVEHSLHILLNKQHTQHRGYELKHRLSLLTSWVIIKCILLFKEVKEIFQYA